MLNSAQQLHLGIASVAVQSLFIVAPLAVGCCSLTAAMHSSMVKLIGGSILVSEPPAPSPSLQINSSGSEVLLVVPLTVELEQFSSQTPNKPVINSPSIRVNVGHQNVDDSAFVQAEYVTPL